MLKIAVWFFFLNGVAGFALLTVQKSYVEIAASGLPFDHPGQVIYCKQCHKGNALWTKSGYLFHCAICDETYRCRWNAREHVIEINW